MIKSLIKQPQFIIGTLFILTLLFLSMVWHPYMDGPKETKFLQNESGRIIKMAPFTPEDIPPFGTDLVGRHLSYLVFEGAKYTILITLSIAFLRIFIALLFSLFYRGSFFDDIVQATLYIPTTILAYMLMSPLFIKNAMEPIGFMKIVIIQCLILAGVGIPPLVSTLSEEIKTILNKDYIINTFSIGSKKSYVYYKHVLPELSTKLVLVFAQQTIQILILLAHLGVLLIFIGGADFRMLGDIFDSTKTAIPISGEWAGIIGQSFRRVMTYEWIVLIPLFFFIITIFAINLIIQGVQKCIDSNGS